MNARRIEVSLSQDKINLINDIYHKELDYWKDAALKMALEGDKANPLKNLAPPRFLLILKATTYAKKTDIDEILSHIKSQYLTNNRDQITFVQNFPSENKCLLSKEYKKN